jgi:polyisoprenoid-binding protein YceI
MSDTATVPGYVTGTWTIDPVHSDVSFTVRHMMVSKVRGKFTSFSGTLVTGETPTASSVTATIDLASIDTGNADRDNHVRSADFFNVEAHQQMTFVSTGVRADGSDFVLDGNLTLKGVTKPVSLHLELGGFGPDAYGGTRAGFTATGEILRSDFGVDFNAVMETGGVILSDKVQVILEIEAVLNT